LKFNSANQEIPLTPLKRGKKKEVSYVLLFKGVRGISCILYYDNLIGITIIFKLAE
jgi:hypothetical protein